MLQRLTDRLRFVDFDPKISPILGRGNFSIVYGGARREQKKLNPKWDAAEVAVKVLQLPKKVEEGQKLIGEIEIMARLHHPALLSLFAWGCRRLSDTDAPVYVLVTRRLGQTLGRVFEQERKGLSPPTWDATRRSIVALGIAAGMAYLHSRKPHPVIYRDLKPENVLLDENLEPLICDFGLSKLIDAKEQCARTMGLGTPLYMAPEMHGLDEHNRFVEEYGTAVDVYAYGMLLYELVTSKQPFTIGAKLSALQLAQKVIHAERPKFPPGVSADWREFIENCWSQSPGDRPTFEGMLRTPDEFMMDGCEEGPFEAYKDKVLAFLKETKTQGH
jgi:serine/threonine protein kinase